MKIRQALIEQAPSLELQRAAAAEIARLDAALADAERRLALLARPVHTLPTPPDEIDWTLQTR